MKYTRFILSMVVAVWICVSASPARAGLIDAMEPSVVFLSQDSLPGGSSNYGSGFLINKNNRPILVTASHVARDLGSDFRLVMTGSDGRGVTIPIRGADWRLSDSADVALLNIKARDSAQREWLLRRAIPARQVLSESKPPSREFTLTMMGYPLALGTKGYVSPLSLETRPASGFISLERFDTKKIATFILMQNPSITGLSGGPVFDFGRHNERNGKPESIQGVSIVGLVSGVIWDKTGGKFSMIVPATEIARLLESSAI